MFIIKVQPGFVKPWCRRRDKPFGESQIIHPFAKYSALIVVRGIIPRDTFNPLCVC